MNFYKILLSLLLIIFLLSCTNDNNNSSIQTTNIQVELNDTNKIWFDDEFFDFELIKLENNVSCMLSSFNKLIATDKYLYILDGSPVSTLYQFNYNGSFIRQIGKRGHAQNEYYNIYDIAINTKGDSVLILDSHSVKTYFESGEFLNNLDLPDNHNYQSNIAYANDGYYIASYTRTSDNLIYYVRNTNNKNMSLVSVDDEIINMPSPCGNPFQQIGDSICYYDFPSSTFFLFDINNPSNVQQIVLESSNMRTVERLKEVNWQSDNYDGILDYVFNGRDIYGSIMINGNEYNIQIEKNNNECHVSKINLIDYGFSAYHNGWYYVILHPNWIHDMIDFDNKFRGGIFKKDSELKSLFEKMCDNLNEKDNYVVLRARKKI